MIEVAMWGSTSTSRTISGHVPGLVAIETLPCISAWPVTPSSPSSIVGFLVVGFVGVRRGWDPLVGSQFVETHTVRLLAESMGTSPAWHSER